MRLLEPRQDVVVVARILCKHQRLAAAAKAVLHGAVVLVAGEQPQRGGSVRRAAADPGSDGEHLLEREGIPMLDTTAKSIEEIATTITYRAKLRRHIY